MPLVDSDFSAWLRDEARFTTAQNASVPSGLQTGGPESEMVSALAFLSNAQAEAARQIAILGFTIAIDEHLIDGQRMDLLGLPVTLTAPYLEYDAGATVFVIGAEENDDDTTRLTVVRRIT